MSEDSQTDAFHAIASKQATGASGYDLSSLPDAAVPPSVKATEEVEDGPLNDRLRHKAWKVRSAAYAELEKKCKCEEPDSDFFGAHAASFASVVGDSNAVAQTAGVAAFAAFVEAAPPGIVADVAETVAPVLVAKCLGGRPATQRAASDALLLVLDAGCVDQFLGAVETGLQDRKAKVPPQCGALLVAATTKHGRALPLGRFVEIAKAHITTTNSGLRQEMKSLTGVLSIRHGPAALSRVSEGLRDALVKELEAAAEEAKATVQAAGPSVPLRADRERPGSNPTDGSGAGASMPGSSASAPTVPGLADNAGDWAERSGDRVLSGLDPEKAMQSKKWSDRKGVFDAFVERSGADPKLSGDDDYTSLLTSIKAAALKDSNVAVVGASLRALRALACGRREAIREEALAFLPDLLGKFKEKKQVVVQAVREAAVSILQHCVGLEDALPVIQEAASHRLPQVQQGTLDVLGDLFENAPLRVVRESTLRPSVALLESKLAETNPVVRESACISLGKAVSLLGTSGPLRPMLGRVETSHTHQHKRILDLAGPNPGQHAAAVLAAAAPPSRAQEQSKAASARPNVEPSSSRQSPRLAKRAPRAADEGDAQVKGPVSPSGKPKPKPKPKPKLTKKGPPARLARRLAGEKTPGAAEAGSSSSSAVESTENSGAGAVSGASARAGAGAGAGAGAAVAPEKGEPLAEPPTLSGGTDGKGLKSAAESVSEKVGESRPDPSVEDAAAVLSGLPVGGGWSAVSSGLSSSKWQERKNAFEALAEVVTDGGSAKRSEACIVVALANTKQMKESNVNVVKAAVGMVTAAVQGANDSPVSFRALKHVLDPVFGKLGDRRAKDAIPPLALAACESVGPQFVLGVLYGVLLKPASKAPLLLQNALELALDIVREFGASSVQVIALVEYCKTDRGLESRNKGVRDAACAVLAEVHRQLGSRVCKLLGDLKKQLADELVALFMKVGVSVSSQPKRAVKAAARALAASDFAEPTRERADVAKALTPKMIAKIKAGEGKDAWKVRLEGVKDVLAVLDGAGRFVQPCKQIRDVLLALKQRFTDKNANVKARSIAAVGVVGEALGVKAAFFSKFVLGDMMPCAADSKRGTHDAFIGALTGWAVHDSEGLAGGKKTLLLDAVIHYACPTLDDTASSRETLLQWMGEHVHPWLDGEYLHTPTAHSQGTPATVLRDAASSFIKCLADRSKVVRDAATVLLSACVRACGPGPLRRATRDLKPATMRAMQPYLDSVYADAESRGRVSSTDDGEEEEGQNPGSGEDTTASGAPAAGPSRSSLARGRDPGASSVASVDDNQTEDDSQPPSSAPSSPARPSQSRSGTGVPSPSGLGRTRSMHGGKTTRPGTRRAATALHRRPGQRGADESGNRGPSGQGGSGTSRRPLGARPASRARVNGIRRSQSGREGPSSSRAQGSDRSGAGTSGLPAPSVSRFRAGRRAASQIPSSLASATRKIQQEVAEQESAPALKMGPSGGKALREKRAAREKWSPDLLNSDLVARLEESTSHVADPELQKQMWSRNARDHVLAAVRLARAVREEVDETVASLDLVLRWVAVRLSDRENVQATSRLCELLLQTFSMLEGLEYKLSEYEAQCLIPFLVEKLGHPKQRFRDAFKQVFGLFVQCYSRNGAVPLLLDGLRSKNMRARVECLDELGQLMDLSHFRSEEQGGDGHGRYDWQVLGKRGLARVAAQVNENDAEVRKAALGVMEMAWVACGRDLDALLAQVPRVPTKVKGLMEERFKFSTLSSGDEGSDGDDHPAHGSGIDEPGARHGTGEGSNCAPRPEPVGSGRVSQPRPLRHSPSPAVDTVDVDALVVEIDKTLSSAHAPPERKGPSQAQPRASVGSNSSGDVFAFKRLSLSSTGKPSPSPLPDSKPAKAERAGPRSPSPNSTPRDTPDTETARRKRCEEEAEALARARAAVANAVRAPPDTAAMDPDALVRMRANVVNALAECRSLRETLLEQGEGTASLSRAVLDPIKVIAGMAKDATAAMDVGVRASAASALAEAAAGSELFAVLVSLLDAGQRSARAVPSGLGARVAENVALTLCRTCEVPGLLQRADAPSVRACVRVCAEEMLEEAAVVGTAAASGPGPRRTMMEGLNVVLEIVTRQEATAPALHALLSVALACTVTPGSEDVSRAAAVASGGVCGAEFVAGLDGAAVQGAARATALAEAMGKQVTRTLSLALEKHRSGPRSVGPDAPDGGAALIAVAAEAAAVEDAALPGCAREAAIAATARASALCVHAVEGAWRAAGRGGEAFADAVLGWCGGDRAAADRISGLLRRKASVAWAEPVPLSLAAAAAPSASSAPAQGSAAPQQRASRRAPDSAPVLAPASPPSGADVSADAELERVATLLADPACADAAIEALHRFQTEHPGVSTSPALRGLSQGFRVYVEEELARVAARAPREADTYPLTRSPVRLGTRADTGSGRARAAPSGGSPTDDSMEALQRRMETAMATARATAAAGARESLTPSRSPAAAAASRRRTPTDGSDAGARLTTTPSANVLRSRLTDLKKKFSQQESSARSGAVAGAAITAAAPPEASSQSERMRALREKMARMKAQ